MGYKQFFLLSPVLWLRKIIVYLLAIVIILGVLVYFIANSPWVIQKVVDTFAPDFNITYSRIYGNALTGVEIDNIEYKNMPLVKHARLKWNPDALLRKEIVLNHLGLDAVNVDTSKEFISDFASDDNESPSSFYFDVYVANLAIAISPFVEEGIAFENIALKAKDIFYSSDKIEVGSAGVLVDSNITKISLNASLEEGVVEVELLDIKALDILAIEQLFISDNNTSSDTAENEANASVNSLMPTEVRMKKVTINIVPMEYDPVNIKKLSLSMQEGIFDIPSLLFKQGKLKIETETNFATALHIGQIKDNQLRGNISLIPKEALFIEYNLPLKRESIGEIDIALLATKKRVIAKFDTNITQVLKAEKDAFNLDIDSLKSTVTYSFDDMTLKANSRVKVSTPYAKNIVATNFFVLDDNISYSGDVLIKQIIGIDAKFVKPINDLKLKYTGDEKSINTTIDSAMIEGHFISDDFKTAILHLRSKEALELRNFVELPSELNASKATVVIDIPLSFESNASYVARAKVVSDIVNIDVNISYKDTLSLTSVIDVHKKSLLRPYSEALKWDALMPVYVEAELSKTMIKTKIDAGSLKTKANYDFNTTQVEGTISLGGLQANISGIAQKEIKIDSKITAIPLLMKSISDIYTLDELAKVEGSANLSLTVKELKQVKLSLNSPLLVYHAEHKSTTDISDIDMLLHYEEGKFILEHYKITYGKEKIYATKPSTVSIVEDIIRLKPLWVNDQLKVEGNYDLKTKQGKILAIADKFKLSHEIIELDSKIDITTLLDGNKTNVKGKVILLSGNIHYDLSKKSFASDSDIIIVQDIKEEKESPFMDNLSVEVQVKTKKPLRYNKGAINIKVNVDLSVYKVAHAELLVLGTVEVLRGGSYIFQEKRFILEKSFIHFSGNPNKPILDIKVKYTALNHVVTIGITGGADLPHISFSSKPSLSKEQILSLILFDTEAGAGTNSGDEMMKMMGGAMAKSVLSNVGIKLDHLVLGSGNSVEVGKKLSDKITIIYVNDIISEVKLKYRHGKHTQSVIGTSEESQFYDIIYKIDF